MWPSLKIKTHKIVLKAKSNSVVATVMVSLSHAVVIAWNYTAKRPSVRLQGDSDRRGLIAGVEHQQPYVSCVLLTSLHLPIWPGWDISPHCCIHCTSKVRSLCLNIHIHFKMKIQFTVKFPTSGNIDFEGNFKINYNFEIKLHAFLNMYKEV